MQHWSIRKIKLGVGKVTGATFGGVLDAAWQRHSKERLSSHCRLARFFSFFTHTQEGPEKHTLTLSSHPLTPPTPRYVSFQERSRAKVAIARCRCLSLTVGDSGRLRSLSTETLQHMRSFLKEWPQNPH